MSTPLKFFSDVIDRVTLMTDAIELYSYRTIDFGLKVEGKNIYMEDGDEVMDVIDVKYKPISTKELVTRLVAVEAMEAKRVIDAFVENSSSKESAHFFLNQQMNKLNYLLRAYNSAYKDKREFTPLKMAMQDIWQNLLDKYDNLIDRQYKSDKKSHRTNSSTKVIWTGGPALLATFFHELRTQGKSQSEAPLIMNDWQELGTWIRDNFLDEKGNELSEETIMTYIDPGRKDKKSKRYSIKVVKQ